MKLLLQEKGKLILTPDHSLEKQVADHTLLTVLYCGVCRTDAKMWQQGHRDLVLPRVLGHEIVGMDRKTNQLYAVWPGQNCGDCNYCRMGRDNLCDDMHILGFHSDGGFSTTVSIPSRCLLPIPANLEPRLATFAEPVACVINGLSRCPVTSGVKALVYGAGVMGLVAALVLKERGAEVTVIEKHRQKIARQQQLFQSNGILICKETSQDGFNLAINCCDSPQAFQNCLSRLSKGGRFCFFSGLAKDQHLDTTQLNLIHYKELEIYGSYGPSREQMQEALYFCTRKSAELALLVERIIPFAEVESVFPHILSGEAGKYIVDCQMES